MATRRERAHLLREVVAGYFFHKRYSVFFEVEVGPRRTGLKVGAGRVDLMAINPRGHVIIVELKSSRADFQTDHKKGKWRAYLDHSHQLYFAFPPDVKIPEELKDEPVGILVPGPSGYVRVAKRSPWRPLSGKLLKSTVMSLIYRAGDRNRLKNHRVRWADPD